MLFKSDPGQANDTPWLEDKSRTRIIGTEHEEVSFCLLRTRSLASSFESQKLSPNPAADYVLVRLGLAPSPTAQTPCNLGAYRKASRRNKAVGQSRKQTWLAFRESRSLVAEIAARRGGKTAGLRHGSSRSKSRSRLDPRPHITLKSMKAIPLRATSRGENQKIDH